MSPVRPKLLAALLPLLGVAPAARAQQDGPPPAAAPGAAVPAPAPPAAPAAPQPPAPQAPAPQGDPALAAPPGAASPGGAAPGAGGPAAEGWEEFPEEAAAPAPAPAAPGTGRAPSPALRTRRAPAPPPRPEHFNRVSLFGAQPLGVGGRAMGAYLGFPVLGARAAVGVLPTLDVGLVYESFYGVMHDFRASARLQLLSAGRWDVAAVVEGGRTLFLLPPRAEERGARWLTGRRNWNVLPGVVVSLRGESPQSPRLFAELRYHLAIDTEPVQRDPLAGRGRALEFLHNVPVRAGAELPFSPATSLLVQLGFDVHTSPLDAAFMPAIGAGVVTAF